MGVFEIPSGCAKVSHTVKIKVTRYYYTGVDLYNGALSKHVARRMATDLEWETLVRTWGGRPWGGPRMVDLRWRWRIYSGGHWWQTVEPTYQLGGLRMVDLRWLWRLYSGGHVVADRGANLPIRRT